MVYNDIDIGHIDDIAYILVTKFSCNVFDQLRLWYDDFHIISYIDLWPWLAWYSHPGL